MPGQRETTIPWKAVAAVVLAGQFLWLLLESLHLFGRLSLTSDFALFYQAWHAIAGGHLSPTTTIYRTGPFLSNHFELLVYPLALLEWIDPGGFILLVLQDLAAVLAAFVAFAWSLELLDEHWGGGSRGRYLIAGSALLVLALDPWIWWSSAFDFHLQVFSALFGVLTARGFWRRRWVSGSIWAALTLCCGSVESVALLGIGVGLIISGRRLWRQGLALTVATLAWILSLNAAGYDNGSQLANLYGYLANPAPGAQVHITQVIAGVLRHPRLAFDMVKVKRTYLWQIVAGSGLLGLFSSIGAPVAVALLIPAVLNAQLSVVQPEASFQVIALLILLPVGSALFLCWLSRRPKRWRIAANALGAAALVEAVVLGVVWIPRSAPYFDRTDARAATVLSTVLAHTPPGAEVIASNGFVGRFANRPWIYALEQPVATTGSVPVHTHTVEFVLSWSEGLETTPKAHTQAAVRQLAQRLHATQVLNRAGIHVFLWHPPAGVHRVTLPGL